MSVERKVRRPRREVGRESVDETAYHELREGSDAREFLLAERPALVRGTLWLSLLLLGTLVGWACVGRIDVVVSAPGVVRPRGDVVQVQAPVSGVVTEVLVREGQDVAADAVLLRFDLTPLQLERRAIDKRVTAKQSERRDAEDHRKRIAQSYQAERATRAAELDQARLQVELEKVRRDTVVKQARARLEIAQARAQAVQARIAEQEKRVAQFREWVRNGVRTKIELDQEQTQLANFRADLLPELKAVEEARLACEPDETQVKIAEASLAQRQKLADEMPAAFAIKDHEASSRVTQLEHEIVAAENERAAVDARIQRAEVRSPVSGVVTQLAVTHAGRVVPEGSTIAHVSPSGRDLVLEAQVRNNDRAEIREGRPVKMRFAAFPYQEYGALEGEVVEVGKDAVKADAASDPVYKVTITLAKSELVNHRGKGGRIELGMSAQADIVVDEKPLILIVMNELREFLDFRRIAR